MQEKKPMSSLTLMFLIIFASSFMAIGYATVNDVSLNISGYAGVAENGDIKITNVRFVNERSQNLEGVSTPVWTDDSIDFDITIKPSTRSDVEDKDYVATYEVTIYNDSLYSNKLSATTFNPTIKSGDASKITVTYVLENKDGGAGLNSDIPAKSEETFYVIINLYPTNVGTFNVTGSTDVVLEEADDGELIGTIPANSTGDLTGSNTYAMFNANVLNTYKDSKDFTLSISNENFELVDQNGNPIGTKTVDGNDTISVPFYIKIKDGVVFATERQVMNVYFEPEDYVKNSMGIITIMVDKDETILDLEAPVISNVQAAFNPSVGTVDVSWSGNDANGVSHYTIETYKVEGNSETLVKTNTTTADETSIQITGLEDTSYYFKVYGIDPLGNTATNEEINSCSQAEGSCSKSLTQSYDWHFEVVLRLTNATSSAGNRVTVDYDGTFETTLSGSGGNDRPNEITSITMNGTALSASASVNEAGYTYNSNNGSLTIRHITGDVEVQASGYNGGCFTAGTKIMLANGQYKNIEDIKYDDLLAVWNYDTASLTYEYPLWIENEHETSMYIKISFEDGTILNIVNNHGLYNTETNKFVNVVNPIDFHIGSKIAKIDGEGNFNEVKVTNIEYIYEKVKFYFVGSTTYYNVIANNILTTDENLMISNLYGFEDNAKWPEFKYNVLNDKNNLLDYSYFSDILPYYLYKGFRVQEAGYLINYNFTDLKTFKEYINKLVLNPYMIKNPIEKMNKRYWMVTTSEDNYLTNKSLFLKQEGSKYILPNSKNNNFIGWLNTSDNKVYSPGDSIEVIHGLHFIALYK